MHGTRIPVPGNICLDDQEEKEVRLDIYCKDLGQNIQIYAGDCGKIRLLTTGPCRKAILMLSKAWMEGHYCNLLQTLQNISAAGCGAKEDIYRGLWSLYDGYDPDNEYPDTISDQEKGQEILAGICSGLTGFYNRGNADDQQEMKQELKTLAEETGKSLERRDIVYEEELMRALIRSDRVRTSFCCFRQVDHVAEAARLAWFPVIHPVQTRMLFEKCKLSFALNSIVDQNHEDRIYKKMLKDFQTVQDQAEAFQEISPELTKLYEHRKNELFYTLFPEDNEHLYEESSVYIARIRQGYVFFGKKKPGCPEVLFGCIRDK